MKTDGWAGELMEKLQGWIERAAIVETPAEADKVNLAFSDELKAGAFPGAMIRIRRVKDIHPVNASPEDPIRSEVYIELIDEGIRLSAFYGKGGEFIGWSYFDRGDIPISEIRKHIGNWRRNIPRGRPLKEPPGPLTDEKIYELVITRGEWLSPLFDSPGGRKPSITEAIEYIVYEQIEGDPEDESMIADIRLAYERERRRKRQ